ncbi:hypothetical protein RSOLAG1IB_01653 [Rhizoctonia solani AG-1 IB]|uniref:Peptidase C14 caspase domain-containing protein n=1 Tax=Thanatephorus cucumeris (strain AG1-IB / isolate 7/3/14) TaxID=1108050 RepID=A0A0B7FCA0_THACB|nr:hypothetical protein RSOLAG1IB_01653 [Rhizoctonia solani AG-1 IB]
MPVISLPPLSHFATEIATPAKTQANTFIKQDDIVTGTTSLTFSAINLSSTSSSDFHWSRMTKVIVVVVVVLLALGLIVRATHHVRRVHQSELDIEQVMPETEVSTLIGTRSPSTTTLHVPDASNWQNYQSVAHTAVHTPDQSIRRSTGVTIKLPKNSNFILEDDDRHVLTSPTGYSELLANVLIESSTDAARRQASAALSEVDPIGSGGFDWSITKSRTLEPATQEGSAAFKTQTQSRQDLSKDPLFEQTSELRAQTAPCIKYRSTSFIKKLTSLVSVKKERIHVLGIGMSGIGDEFQPLPGPIHDIRWLKSAFDGRDEFSFKSLLDSNATLEEVRRSLEDMHSEAGENDLIVLYFSGHGGPCDSFQLYDPASPGCPTLLNATILNQWIGEFRSETRGPPVYVIFDCCRPDLVAPETKLNDGVYIIWACSPMQPALDLGLNDPHNHLPRSCFLLALILAIDDLSEGFIIPAVQRFTERMKELVRVIRGSRADAMEGSHSIPAPATLDT